MNTKKEVPLVVTTVHRGVFFGYGIPSDADTIKLKRARMAVYWPVETHGVVGLASDGPPKGARISPAAPEIILRDVTSVMVVSPEATEKWEMGPWTD